MPAYNITYRTTGAWGVGLGSRIPKEKVDESFYSLALRVTAIEDNPPAPIDIDNITVESGLMTIFLSDYRSFGPFVLPSARWNPKGEWLPDTNYFAFDVVTNAGNVYIIRLDHTSEDTFAADEDQGNGFLYMLMLSRELPYDISFYYDGATPSGEAALFVHVASRAYSLAASLAGCIGFLRVATSTSPVTYPIYKNNSIIGHLQFIPGNDTTTDGGQLGKFNSITPDDAIAFAVEDRLSIALPYEDDDTAAGLTVTFKGTIA